jgi:hypothetical protein
VPVIRLLHSFFHMFSVWCPDCNVYMVVILIKSV